MFAREMYPSPVWIVNQNRNFNNIINGSIADFLIIRHKQSPLIHKNINFFNKFKTQRSVEGT